MRLRLIAIPAHVTDIHKYLKEQDERATGGAQGEDDPFAPAYSHNLITGRKAAQQECNERAAQHPASSSGKGGA